jgi:hypothetical protein
MTIDRSNEEVNEEAIIDEEESPKEPLDELKEKSDDELENISESAEKQLYDTGEEKAEGEEEEPIPAGEQVDEAPAVDQVAELTKTVEKLSNRVGYMMRQQQTGQAPAPAPEPKKEETPPPDRPNEEDFDTYEEYQEALLDWKVDRKIEEDRRNRETETEKNRGIEQAQEKFAEDVQKGREKYNDFEVVAFDPTNTAMTPMVAEIVRESEMMPDLAYYFGKNRNELAVISRMTPIRAAAEIGKVEAKLQAEFDKGGQPKVEPTKTTKAPPAIKPTGSSGTTGISKDPNSMTNEEYRAARKAGKL